MTVGGGPIGQVRLTDIAELNPRAGHRLADDAQVAFLPMADVTEAGGLTSPIQTRPFCEVSRGYTPFQEGDILVAKITPCFQNGKIATADILPSHVGFGSTEFHVVRPNTAVVDRQYLLHFLRQPAVRTAGERRMIGSGGQRRVPENFFADLHVPLLPLPEQRRIAAVLDAAEATAAKRQSSADVLASLEQAIYREMFGPLASRRDAAVLPLSTCARIVSGVAKGRKFGTQATVRVPYLRVANVQAGRLDMTEVKMIEVLPREASELSLLPGDIVMTEGGDFDKLGRGAMWNAEVNGCIHQNHIFRVRLDQHRVRPVFFHAYLQTPTAKAYFLRCAKKTTNLASINMRQLRALPTPTPPIGLQQEFCRAVEQIEVAQKVYNCSMRHSKELFASLQHRAFRGEL